jgi:hypothetical protein
MCMLSEPEISRSVLCPGCWLAPIPVAWQNRPVAMNASRSPSPPGVVKWTDGVLPGTAKRPPAGASPGSIRRTLLT